MKKFIFLFSFTLFIIFLSVSSSSYAGEGHDAGYEWAQEHDIQDANYDNGNSESFNEGVRQYAEEMQEQEHEAEENEEDEGNEE